MVLGLIAACKAVRWNFPSPLTSVCVCVRVLYLYTFLLDVCGFELYLKRSQRLGKDHKKIAP